MLTLSALADARDMDTRVWDRLRCIEAEHAVVYRLSRAPALLAGLYEETLAMLSDESGALVHATVERGVVRAILPLDAQLPPARAARALRRFDATIVTERAPEQDRIVRHPHAAGDTAGARGALAARVREAFDPDCILNPGILAEAAE
jgi:FAD/FMN-containing dehydrogenase